MSTNNTTTNTKEILITKEMIEKGYEQNIVRLSAIPWENWNETVCWIGESWFFFGGMLAEELLPKEYIKEVPKEDIIQEIFDTLEGFRTSFEEFESEYAYYYWILKENLK